MMYYTFRCKCGVISEDGRVCRSCRADEADEYMERSQYGTNKGAGEACCIILSIFGVCIISMILLKLASLLFTEAELLFFIFKWFTILYLEIIVAMVYFGFKFIIFIFHNIIQLCFDALCIQ